MPATIETTVYQFEELSDDAKERAREWFRNCQDSDNSFAECTLDDANTIAQILGIDIAARVVHLYNNTTRQEPEFQWDLERGGGVCFDARYSYGKQSVKKIREYAPQDKILHAIADSLFAIQRKHFFGLSARIEFDNRGIGIQVYGECTHCAGVLTNFAELDIYNAIDDFCHWIHKQLESEYEYQNSDEQVDESIIANEYTFTEEGKRF